MLWCQMRIADGHLNSLVPHQLLNCAKVNARHNQPACESVAEAMPGEVLQPRSLHGGTKPEPRRAQTRSVTGEEHIWGCRFCRPQVFATRRLQRRSNRGC